MRLQDPQLVIVPTFIPSATKSFSCWPASRRLSSAQWSAGAERKPGQLGNELSNHEGSRPVFTPQKSIYSSHVSGSSCRITRGSGAIFPENRIHRNTASNANAVLGMLWSSNPHMGHGERSGVDVPSIRWGTAGNRRARDLDRGSAVDRSGHYSEVYMVLQHPQGVSEVIELRTALPVGKRLCLIWEIRSYLVRQHHARIEEAFEVP